MRRRPARRLQIQATDPVASALCRARRARRRGTPREVVNALRLACSLREYDPTLWTMLGAALLRMDRTHEAVDAFRHALWLRERAGEERRAVVTRCLIDCVLRGVSPSARAA